MLDPHHTGEVELVTRNPNDATAQIGKVYM